MVGHTHKFGKLGKDSHGPVDLEIHENSLRLLNSVSDPLRIGYIFIAMAINRTITE